MKRREFIAATAADLPHGAPVTCCIRPEHIRISTGDGPEADAAENQFTLDARIESVTFLGETRQYVCCLAGQDVCWKVTALSLADALPTGADVKLRIRPQNVTILRR